MNERFKILKFLEDGDTREFNSLSSDRSLKDKSIDLQIQEFIQFCVSIFLIFISQAL